MKRPSVIDAYNNAFVIVEACYPGIAGQGQGRVSGGHGKHVIALTIGCLAAVEFFAIPGGRSGLGERLTIPDGDKAHAEYFVRSQVSLGKRLDTRGSVRDVGNAPAAVGHGAIIFVVASAALP